MEKKIVNKSMISKGPIIVVSIIIVIFILAIFSFIYFWTELRVDIPAVEYIDDYRDYYFTTRFVKRRALFGYVDRQIIYFLPGQKGKMLKKIKEDVINELERLITKHGDIFYKYEISDDFKQVRIYESSGDIDVQQRDELDRIILRRVLSLTGLYHCVKNGRSASIPTDYTFDTIKSAD